MQFRSACLYPPTVESGLPEGEGTAGRPEGIGRVNQA